jgi:DNA mismatch repair protein MSH6
MTMMMPLCVSPSIPPVLTCAVAVAEEYEASAAASPSIAGSSPVPEPKKKANKGFVAPKLAAKSSSSFPSSSSGPSRPAAKPLAGASSSMRSASASDNFLLTAAERNRIVVEETKRDNEQCFDFLKPENVRDKDGNRPDHPDYDTRTIMVPKSAWASFTPFEKQFWEIKQNHFDTVLFFQKGKFYELYEDDALIGHQEFDLKLTDRVKMKMVS